MQQHSEADMSRHLLMFVLPAFFRASCKQSSLAGDQYMYFRNGITNLSQLLIILEIFKKLSHHFQHRIIFFPYMRDKPPMKA